MDSVIPSLLLITRPAGLRGRVLGSWPGVLNADCFV
jgi:hypothetical protein